MRVQEAFPSNFLKAADLNKQAVTVTIESAEMIELGQGRDKEIDGGWKILNHAKYQMMMSLEERQAYWRRKKKEAREREKENKAGMTAKEIVRHQREVKDKLGIL